LTVSLNRARPADGVTWPVRASNSVVLPAPFGPISNRTRSSRSTMRLRFRSARNPSKDTVRFST